LDSLLSTSFPACRAGTKDHDVVTLSGTNRWHGDENFSSLNSVFDAREPEAQTHDRPRFRNYNPNASLNGPIRKDRRLFSTSLEGEYESSQDFSKASGATALNDHKGVYRY
jgi:hypothetical protein